MLKIENFCKWFGDPSTARLLSYLHIFFLLVCIIAGTYIDLMLQKVNFKNW